MEAVDMSKAGFSTPQNDQFYKRRPYRKLNIDRKEIRLLQVQRQRMTIFEVEEQWPEWRGRAYPTLSSIKPSEPPGDGPAYRVAKNWTGLYVIIPQQTPMDGWKEFTSAEPKMNPNFYNNDYRCHKPWYFNIYTGESTWDAPSKPVYSPPTSALIVCELIDPTPLTSVFARNGKYTTLSYCAGDPDHTTEIIVNGFIFNAFNNLEHSLECIRQYWVEHSHEDLLIWTDQVCIDQSDYREKSHQVDMMGEIFKNSWQTFACLSTASIKSSLSTPPDLKILQNYLADRWPDEVPRRTIQQDGSGDINGTHNSYQSTIVSVWQGLRLISELIRAPWWTRAWVFQEIILSLRVSVLYHGFCCRWPDLSPMIYCFCKHQYDIIQSLNDFAKTQEERLQKVREEQRSKRRSAFGPFATVDRTPRVPSGYFYPAYSTQHKPLYPEPSEKQLATALYTISAKTNWSGSYDLRIIVENMHKFLAKDPRDLMFAFLGLIGPEWGLKSDYSPEITLQHVLVGITSRLILHEDRLDILVDAIRRKGKVGLQLPSWVPDWTVPRSPAMQPPLQLRDSMRKFRASKSTKAGASFLAHQGEKLYVHLQVTGIEGDTLSQIEHDTEDDIMYFRSLGGRMIITSVSAQVGDNLWVIHGADPVFVLRHEKDSCYVLISTALVIDYGEPVKFSSIMNGELINRANCREVAGRVICLI